LENALEKLVKEKKRKMFSIHFFGFQPIGPAAPASFPASF
jgi:hypothetical protein